MEWNLRNRLEAARESRRSGGVAPGDDQTDEAAEVTEPVIDLTERPVPADTQGPARRPAVDFRTVSSVRAVLLERERAAREQEERQTREVEENQARASASWSVTPLPAARPRHQTFAADEASISTIVRPPDDHAQRATPIPTTRPAQERCPNCGGSVRIDMFDLVQAVAHLTCLDCGFIYTAKSPN